MLGILLLSLSPFGNCSNPAVSPAAEVADQNISFGGLKILPLVSVETKAIKKRVGRRVSYQEAFAANRRILQKAEQARIDAAEIEAKYGIPWNNLRGDDDL
jgi:hypothetical protein